MPQRWNKPSVGQSSHRPQIFNLDDDRLLDFAFTQVRDDAVAARRRVLHDAGVAIDGDALDTHVAQLRDVV